MTRPAKRMISQLDSYLVIKGILRVGGRLKRSDLSVEENRLAVLPNKCKISKTIIQ